MAVVEADISMSVDGFVTGPDLDKWHGLGKGGERLHAWLEHEEGRRLSEATFAASGAIVTSRRVDEASGGWGEDGFYELEHLDTADTPEATHVTYRVGQPWRKDRRCIPASRTN